MMTLDLMFFYVCEVKIPQYDEIYVLLLKMHGIPERYANIENNDRQTVERIVCSDRLYLTSYVDTAQRVKSYSFIFTRPANDGRRFKLSGVTNMAKYMQTILGKTHKV